MNPKVDFYFNKAKNWQEELIHLRKLVLECGLSEELKWGVPCYCLNKSNIVLIHVFKEYSALLFFKGALLNDPKAILVQQTKNTQATRQIRFTNVKEIVKLKSVIKAFIFKAIEVEKAGIKVEYKKSAEYKIPEEFESEMKESSKLKKAFQALTPGRQRAYILHFSSPKLSKTRASRVEKYIHQILMGKGLND
ncbi:MAG: DUF1801 domain-containing protein [Saprospiraceae bacterium]